MKASLRIECGSYCFACRVECYSKRIPNNLKNVAVMRLNGLVENFMMPRKQSRHRIRILLRQFCAAFDISKEERNGARGEICHTTNPLPSSKPDRVHHPVTSSVPPQTRTRMLGHQVLYEFVFPRGCNSAY